ncbi:MAG: zinc-binding dehydrogenase [Nannocystaceae bacterium]
MRAVSLSSHGDSSVLQLGSIPVPAMVPGHVRVQVHACALNRLDIWVRRGLPHLRLQYPHILGSDVAGVITEVADDVAPSLCGSEVIVNPGISCGRCRACLSGDDNFCPDYKIIGEHIAGGYAEELVIPAANVMPKPATLSMAEAASLPLTFLTAWQMLVTRAAVTPGETVLIHAAGSGVGVMAIQIAKRFGASVIALASTQEKLDQARSLGADHCILSGDGAWYRAVRALPHVGKRGVDVVFEHVGASTWSDSIKIARRGGRVVTCGASSGWEATTDLRHVFYRQVQILGSTMGSKGSLYNLAPLVETGDIRPVVDRVFPLEAAAQAHEYLDQRTQFGKVVLSVHE